MAEARPYPSLQGDVEFSNVPAAVAVLDAVVVELKRAHDALDRVGRELDRLPLRRWARPRLARLLVDLERDRDKVDDVLDVYGFRRRAAKDRR